MSAIDKHAIAASSRKGVLAAVTQDEVRAQDSRASQAEAALAAAQAARSRLQVHWTDHRRGLSLAACPEFAWLGCDVAYVEQEGCSRLT